MGSGKLLKRAISKYGIENFEKIILCFFDSYEEVLEEEKFIVTKEWCKSNTNYNLVEGAENPIMYGKENPSWKGGISKDPMYRRSGRIHDFSGSNNPRWNYKYTEEEKKKMILTQSNRTQMEIEGVKYESLREYSRLHNRSKDYIKRRLHSSEFPKWIII